jgi:hypothetical protein
MRLARRLGGTMDIAGYTHAFPKKIAVASFTPTIP